MMAKACAMDGVTFAYPRGSGVTFHVERLVIDAGEAVLLSGPSGSGKSTLLGLLCGVLKAGEGQITVAGQSMTGGGASGRDRLRADAIGYIFQNLNLLLYLSPVENVLLAATFSKERARRAGATRDARRRRARDLLAHLDLADERLGTSSLSVGQQQRVAVARALFGTPPLLVADEPTAALDGVTRDRFIEVFLGEAKRSKAGVLVVSHDPAIAPHFDRHIALSAVARWEPAR